MSKEEYTKKTDALRKKVIDFQSQRRASIDKVATQRAQARDELMKKIEPINIMNKFSLFNEEWTPKIIGELNDQHVKVCKLKDDFVWHSHENEDELFMVLRGTLFIDFRDGRTVEVKEGEILKNITLNI